MPKVIRKRLGVKQLRKANKTLLQDTTEIASKNRAPVISEGTEGQMTVRLVDGAVKLFVKFRGKWYGILLS